MAAHKVLTAQARVTDCHALMARFVSTTNGNGCHLPLFPRYPLGL